MKFQATLHKGVLAPLPQTAGTVAAQLSRFKPGAVLNITVEPARGNRTLSQNARMWTILSAFEELGWHKDEAKVWCCGEFLPPIVREFPDGTRLETKATKTSTLDTKAMGEFMDRIEHFLNDHGIHLFVHERYER